MRPLLLVLCSFLLAPSSSLLAIPSASTATVNNKAVIEPKKDNGGVEKVMEWKSAMGGLVEGGFHVVRDSEAWQNLWVRVRGEPLPEIDFSKNMVVAVFMGLKPTGGFGVEIEKVEKSAKKVVVHVREKKAPEGSFVIQAFTSPYHIKIVERSGLPVDFKKLK